MSQPGFRASYHADWRDDLPAWMAGYAFSKRVDVDPAPTENEVAFQAAAKSAQARRAQLRQATLARAKDVKAGATPEPYVPHARGSKGRARGLEG